MSFFAEKLRPCLKRKTEPNQNCVYSTYDHLLVTSAFFLHSTGLPITRLTKAQVPLTPLVAGQSLQCLLDAIMNPLSDQKANLGSRAKAKA